MSNPRATLSGKTGAGHSIFQVIRQRSSESEIAKNDDSNVDMDSPIAFVDSKQFQIIVGSVIVANIVEIAFATDMPHWQGWPFIDNIFLLFFFAEIALRLAHKGVAFFIDKDRWWGIVDVVIVGVGILDLWLSRFSKSSSLLSLLRFFRFCRLIRFLRVLRMSSWAMQFVKAIVNMMTKIISIFLVLFMLLGCSAILLTQLLGRAESLQDDNESEEVDSLQKQVRETFRSVPDSFFALYQVTTVDNWDLIASPVIALSPAWRIFFVVFIFFASWVMISILTAVVSDSMIAATSDQKDIEKKIAQKRQSDFIEFLREVFREADVDGNGKMDKQEFEDMISKEFVLRRMRSLGVDMTQADMRNAWGMMEDMRMHETPSDEPSELTIEEFVTGLSCLQETLSTKHVVNANYELKKMACKLDQEVNSLLNELDEVKSQNNEMLRCLQVQDEHYEQHQLSLWLWYEWMTKYEPSAIPSGMTLPIELPKSLASIGIGK